MALNLDITVAPPWAGRWSEKLLQHFNSLLSVRTLIVDNVAGLPDPLIWTGRQVWCKDVGAGAQRLCISDGTNWRRTDTGATV